MSKIYYVIPDLFKANYNLISFLRTFKNYGLKQAIGKIFPRHKPVGGIKVIYQHCMLLNDLGFHAQPVLMGKYKGNFFGYEIDYISKNQALSEFTSDDIVVATEFRPYEGLEFSNGRKVLFFQNPNNIERVFQEKDKEKSYLELGYDYVITCGDNCTKVVKEKMGIDATTITNGIDQEDFYPDTKARITGRVLVLSRKNYSDFEKIRDLCNQSMEVDFHIVDGLTQQELIKEYQQADIFLATGYPEGLPLPPMEAMLCGCAVVGFTGGGAREYMHDSITAMVADDGDCDTAASKLLDVLRNESLKESIRQKGMEKAREYTLERTSNLLAKFYKGILEND